MVRQSSIDAFNEIKMNGLLSLRRMQVYEIVFLHGPLTGGEVGQFMKKYDWYHKSIGTADRNIHARLGELRDQSVIKESGSRICTATGMNVILWELTDTLPIKIKKEKKKKLFYGVMALSFGEPNHLFKTKGLALRYQMNHKCLGTILEFYMG